MHRVNCCLILSTLVVYLLHVSDGCGRTPARTKPPSTTSNPNERSSLAPEDRTTRLPASGKLDCTQEEVKEAACLNGGVCFALELIDTRSAYCQCSEIWTGSRCEEIDDDIYVLSADKLEKASIAAGAVVLAIIVTVVIVYVVVRKRKKRKQRREANGNANGFAGKALMRDDKGSIESEDGEKCTDV